MNKQGGSSPPQVVKGDKKKMQGEIEPQSRERYLTCERRNVFRLLMVSAGMMGAYTYNLRGGVFCNAQTANVVLMAMALGKGQWSEGLYYLIPIFAYMAGAFVSEFLPSPIKHLGLLRWDTILVGFEILVLFGIGWIPLSVPDHVVQVLINFICSMQYNTFRQAEGIPMATTFCTNHVRHIGICLAHYLRHRNKDVLRRAVSYFIMLIVFLAGGILLTALCRFFAEKTIWLAMIPLIIDFCILTHADATLEHDRLEDIPHGH